MAEQPDLAPRFLEPPGWRWHFFERNGRRMRFGSAFPQDSIPDAVVVCLEGVGEFAEKYFETAHWCLSRNLAFWTFDWTGQGKSTRYLKDPHKRHSNGFNQDVADLHYFITEYIKHSSVHPDKGRIPLALLAHSYGAHIGLHYISAHPGIFECAAFSAPLVGIKILESMPRFFAHTATLALSAIMGKCYVPGGGPWDESVHAVDAPRKLSGDPARAAVHNAWCLTDPSLQVGSVTLRWLYEAHKSCRLAQKPGFADTIKMPCLMAIPEHDHLVDNDKARILAQYMPHTQILDLPGAHHEILMETDAIRNRYLDAFYALVKEKIIDRPETLKPF